MARTAAAPLATGVGLAALWLLLVDTVSPPELLVGAGVVCIATVASELVRARRAHALRIRPAWLGGLWRPVARIPLDTVIVLWALPRQLHERRRERGKLRALRFRVPDNDRDGNGRRALAELAGSLAPNTIVIGVDMRRRLILAHQLEPTEGSSESTLDPLGLG